MLLTGASKQPLGNLLTIGSCVCALMCLLLCVHLQVR